MRRSIQSIRPLLARAAATLMAVSLAPACAAPSGAAGARGEAIAPALDKPPAPKTTEPAATGEITRRVIEKAADSGTEDELRLVLVEFPPGAASPAHRHPVAGLCYVIEGTAESQYEGEDMKTFHAGDSYQDSASKTHLVFRNASTTSALRFTCAMKIGKEEQFFQPL